ncbi:MAG: hypothetical protein CMO49_01345 [Verrucomicrobiales bacterium]|nr:hypothetical protein [Verrucomicrobiales bacterium]|tara:strand:- start:8077 stop:8862 length:786 start_codon:yes stop_codon:yes gene_type:complete
MTWLAVSFFIFLTFFTVEARSKDQLTFSAYRMPPYANDVSLGGGVFSLLIKEVFQKYGIETKIKFFSDNSWQELLGNQEVVGHFPVIDLKDISTDYPLRTHVMDAKLYIYRQVSNPLALKIAGRKPLTLKSKKHDRLCVPQYIVDIKGFEDKLAQHKIDYDVALNTGDCKARIISGRNQSMISDELHGLSIGLNVDKEDLLQLEKESAPFLVVGMYVIFNESIPGIEGFKAFFDRELAKMKSNYGFKDIMTRFNEYWSIVY